MHGFYPSIPGWHCDDIPRGTKYAQPDLDKRNGGVIHFCCLISDHPEVSNTEYINEQLQIDVDPANVWSSVDRLINSHGARCVEVAKPGEIIRFTQSTLHRATPCKVPGWRLFFRLSITHRKPVNVLRNQVQVYVPENTGW
jgi:hypothetical protein